LQEVFKNKKRFIALFFKLLLLGSPKYYGAKSLKTGLAATICEFLGWVTPAGRPKTQQCTAFLDELESENIIQLPPKQRDTIRNTLPKLEAMNFDTTEIAGDIRSYEPISLKIARPGSELRKWRSYVNQYHMLGYQQVFGSVYATLSCPGRRN
jgi:hypothetical protein